MEDLLQQANSLRRQTKWQEAARTYERAIAIVPGSRKAYVATAAAASIHLEHLGDPRGALALYQSALRMQPSGVLSEEVRWGIAQSYRALGDRSGEVAALRAFLASHPDSLLRVRAESRLAELE